MYTVVFILSPHIVEPTTSIQYLAVGMQFITVMDKMLNRAIEE